MLEKILKDFLQLSFGETIGKIIAFLTNIYIARIITAEGFGILGYTTAFISYFILFVDFGFNITALKRIAGKYERIANVGVNIICLRIYLSIVAFIVIIITLILLNESKLLKIALLITSLTLISESISTDFIFQSMQKFKLIALKTILKNSIVLILVILFISEYDEILLVIGIFLVANITTSLIYFYKSSLRVIIFKHEIDWTFQKNLLLESYPIVIAVLFSSVYNNIDLIMLGKIKQFNDTGIYYAAVKFYNIGIIPLAIIVKLFMPYLAKFGNSFFVEKEGKIFYKIIAIAGIVTSLFFIVFADFIIPVFFGNDYILAIPILKILGCNIVIVAFNMFFANILIIVGMTKYYTSVVGTAAFINIYLNIYLIPQYSYYGAALSTLFAEVFAFGGVLVLYIFYMKKIKVKFA